MVTTVKGLAAMRVPSLLFQTQKEPSLLSITDYDQGDGSIDHFHSS